MVPRDFERGAALALFFVFVVVFVVVFIFVAFFVVVVVVLGVGFFVVSPFSFLRASRVSLFCTELCEKRLDFEMEHHYSPVT